MSMIQFITMVGCCTKYGQGRSMEESKLNLDK